MAKEKNEARVAWVEAEEGYRKVSEPYAGGFAPSRSTGWCSW